MLKAKLVRLPRLNIPCKIIDQGDRALIMINTYDVAKLIENRMMRKAKDVKYSVHVVDEYIVIEVTRK